MNLPAPHHCPTAAQTPAVRLMAVLLLLLAAALFYVIFRPQPAGLPLAAQQIHEEPRAVVARGDLADDEQSNIDLFSRASPSVVHVTSLALRRSRLNLDVTEIPRGTGSGFMWEKQGHIVTN